MIHSHWLCYKYFYGSVFLFLFPSPFSKKAVWMSTVSRTHIIAPTVIGCYSWRNAQSLPKILYQHFTGEVFGAPGRLRVSAWQAPHRTLGLLNPRAQRIPPHLVLPARAVEVPWTGHCFLQLDLSPGLYAARGPAEISLPRAHWYF